MAFNPCMMDYDVLPPIWLALLERDLGAASRLIEDGAALDDIIEEDGNTLLHVAARDGDVEMVEFFLNYDCPITLEQFDYIQETPLIGAAENGRTEVVVLLLSARVNPNAHDEDHIGNTAIREAVRGGHREIVALLLRAGADPTIPGWMNVSAVDQAWGSVAGTRQVIREIRGMFRQFPSQVRDRQDQQNKQTRRPDERS